jgi:multidrug resistance efflux pump
LSSDAEQAALDARAARARRAVFARQARRWAPWALWVSALLIAAAVGPEISGLGISPGAALARDVGLVSPRVATVAEVKRAVGEDVRAGDVILALDTASIDREIAVAEKEVSRLELEVGARAGSLKRSDLLNRERLASDAERAALEVARVRSDALRAKAELSTIDEQIARQKKLVEERLASQSTLDELNLRRASLAEEVREGQSLVARAEEHRRATRARLSELEGQMGTVEGVEDPAIAPYRAAVEAQKERLAQLRAERDGLAIKAPFAGRVAALPLDVGGTALAGVEVARVVETRPARVVAYVDERLARGVGIGDHAEAAPSDRRGPAYKGTVVALSPRVAEVPIRFRAVPTEAEFGREVFIALDEEIDALPGQAFDVTFRAKAK